MNIYLYSTGIVYLLGSMVTWVTNDQAHFLQPQALQQAHITQVNTSSLHSYNLYLVCMECSV